MVRGGGSRHGKAKKKKKENYQQNELERGKGKGEKFQIRKMCVSLSRLFTTKSFLHPTHKQRKTGKGWPKPWAIWTCRCNKGRALSYILAQRTITVSLSGDKNKEHEQSEGTVRPGPSSTDQIVP